MKTKILGAVAVLAICSVVSPAYGASLGFIYSGGSYTTLTVPGATNTKAFSINNAGQVVGEYPVRFGGPVYGFLYRGHLHDAQ